LKAVLPIIDRELIQKHLSELISKGFDQMIGSESLSDLALLYSLFDRIDALDDVRIAFAAYTRRTGYEIVVDQARDSEMVERLLSLKQRMDKIVRDSFQQNPILVNALRDSFEHFINQRSDRPAELVAKYVDMLMKEGNRKYSDEELESILDRLMVLFRFMHGKDVFEAYYKKDLAKVTCLGRLQSLKPSATAFGKVFIYGARKECHFSFERRMWSSFYQQA